MYIDMYIIDIYIIKVIMNLKNIIIIKYDLNKTKSQSDPKPHTEQIFPVPVLAVHKRG